MTYPTGWISYDCPRQMITSDGYIWFGADDPQDGWQDSRAISKEEMQAAFQEKPWDVLAPFVVALLLGDTDAFVQQLESWMQTKDFRSAVYDASAHPVGKFAVRVGVDDVEVFDATRSAFQRKGGINIPMESIEDEDERLAFINSDAWLSDDLGALDPVRERMKWTLEEFVSYAISGFRNHFLKC